MGLSCENIPSQTVLFLLPSSNTHREWWIVGQRCIQGIANGKVYRDLVQIVLQDDEAGNYVSNDINFSFLSCTYPVGRVVAFPRMPSNVLNDVVESTNPPATLQSIRRISHILNDRSSHHSPTYHSYQMVRMRACSSK